MLAKTGVWPDGRVGGHHIPRPSCLHGHFRAHVGRAPGAISVLHQPKEILFPIVVTILSSEVSASSSGLTSHFSEMLPPSLLPPRHAQEGGYPGANTVWASARYLQAGSSYSRNWRGYQRVKEKKLCFGSTRKFQNHHLELSHYVERDS